ncbi:type I polyketide synthase [Actinomadura sp. NEAU-AAG7]|uniref:type I polyketide synthase n=1 Tax=Actinomadura sp. NEAU-AAG7 TaxID=2839640 RepID=UPI001BE48CC1|nr:type I polyketide synthase [Actinomadura sp. NEAU-AAG7]MBT2210871.1 SDR family NAD(P)-dependent oxidoreductase [Actinomadura sp. NEAU-AAG7]
MANEDRLRDYLKRATTDLRAVRRRLREVEEKDRQPIAIVGAGCRYPGGVDSPEALWRLVAGAGDAIGPFPRDRGWDLAGVYDPDPETPGTTYVTEGGFLPAGDFDAEFFGLSPREATAMDPQQRILLEVAWEAVERAGVDATRLRGSRTGVFVGAIAQDYAPPRVPAEYGGQMLTGTTTSVASGRIAYTFGFEGPAVTIDTACSSSLVAVHLAVQALRRGECGLALAGGVTVLPSPGLFVEFARQRGLSVDGRCKAFAGGADGTGFGEGAGVLLLERLSDAQRNDRTILGVIRGSAVNQDGASNGLTAPSGPAQERVVLRALADAHLEPSDVDVVEGHGTGTTLGDPIEARALLATYGQGRPEGRPLWLGSIKSNIGHTQAAAGVAGIIKMVGAMRHGVLPRTLHVDEPSPHVDWSSGGVSVLAESRPWDAGERPRRAGVSSFGISGTNAHVILEEPPAPEAADPVAGGDLAPVPLLVTGRTRDAVRAQAARLREHLSGAGDVPLGEVAAALATTRTAFEHRAVVLADDLASGLEGLAALASDEPSPRVVEGTLTPGRVAYLFTGQGSQRPGMGRELHAADPVFARALDEVCAHLDPHLDRPLRDVLFADPGSGAAALLDQTLYTQASLFAVETALFRLLEHRGLRPGLLMGHSIGELTAAHVAGVWTLEDAAALVAARGRLMRDARTDGAMIAVQAAEDEVAPLLAGHEDTVAIAAINGPASVVLSGDAEPVAEVAARISALGRKTKRLRVGHAFHSPHMDEAAARFLEVARGVAFHAPAVPIVSNVTGRLADPEQVRDPGYWAGHLRAPVRFLDGVRTLHREGTAAYVEVGPDDTLTALVHECLAGSDPVGASFARGDAPTAVPTLREDRPEPLTAAAALAQVRTVTDAVDPGALHPAAPHVDLPTYAFQRRHYWLRPEPGADLASSGLDGAPHPLLAAALTLADGEGTVFLGRFTVQDHPWLADHHAGGRPVLPGAALADIVLGVADGDLVDSLTIDPLLVLPSEGVVQLQVSVGAAGEDGARSVTVHGRTDDDSAWTRLAAGQIRPAGPGPVAPAGRQEVSGELALDSEIDPSGYGVHPVLLESALQLLASDREPQRLTAIEGFQVHASDASAVSARLVPAGGDAFALTLTDPSGGLVATARTVRTEPLQTAEPSRAGDLLPVEWVPVGDAVGQEDAPPFVVHAVPPSDGDAAAHAHTVARDVLRAVRDWLSRTDAQDSRLVVLTRGAMAVAGTEPGDPGAAAVWGLVRSAQTENPGQFVLLDADDALTDERIGAALATGEPQIALREGEFLVPRLARAAAEGVGGSWGDGTVLITGGTGVLGGVVARHLVVEHGVRDLMLMSRRGGAGALRDELVGLGAEVSVVACDVADRDALAGALSGVRVTAVVHAAGVVEDATIASLSGGALDAVLRAKVDAAWNLHELMRDVSVFVLFSSLAGLAGSAGQANYAAANAFLDALASRRRAEGLPGTSIAWGLWESGMAGSLDQAELARIRRTGVAPLTPDQGLALLDAALAVPDHAVIAAARLNPKALRAQAESGMLPSVLGGLVPAPRRRAAASGRDLPLADLPPRERDREVLNLVRAEVGRALGFAASDTPATDRAFKDLGFTSLTALQLRNRLSAVTGLRLPASLVFDHPTPEAVAAYLVGELSGASSSSEAVVAAAVMDEPVAIVGMACRYPGGASSPEELWRMVAEGRDAVSDFPMNRGWDVEALYDPDPDHVGTSYARRGSFLHDADGFDAAFFGISPREATAMDPQQRLLLETAWEVFERSGIDPNALRGSSTGVFAGVTAGDYAARAGAVPEGLEGHMAVGNTTSVASGRIAYSFGLEGPAITVDTACSSSLVAMHLAVQSLRNGECTMALAGGATIIAGPTHFVEFSRQRALSVDGRCKAFAAAADGTGWGEGVGLLLLERLSDARRNGHRVLAVVRGSAVNQDGASNGLTAPNGPSQERVITQALANAGLAGGDVDVVEAHGTGTALGDPIEAQALLATYGRGRSADCPLWLGSVKSNIGHTQAAAGVAGVIKMVGAMRAGVLPQTLHVDEPSPHVDWSAGAVSLLTESQPWEKDQPRRAAVSSFGISGTNAHIILEQAPEEPATKPAEISGPVPWLVSAKTEPALRAQADRLTSVTDDVAAMATALATTRATLDHRAVIVAETPDQFQEALRALAIGAEAPNLVQGRAGTPGKTVLVFPGQGWQWQGMAATLLDESPVFAESIKRCADALNPFIDWSLEEVLREGTGFERVDVLQPTLWAVMVSLAELWKSAGVTPDAVIGHSQGEIAAAHIAGALTLHDSAKVVALRSQALTALSGTGAMASLPLPHEEAQNRIAAHEGVEIAAFNGPSATVISGDPDAISAIVKGCEAEGIKARVLPVDYASHCAHTEHIRDQILTDLADITPQPPRIPFYSTLTGTRLDTEQLDGQYWYNNLRNPVQFQPAIQQLLNHGHSTFVEASAHPVLATPISDTDVNGETVVTGTLRRDEGGLDRFLASAAHLHVHGTPIDWTPFLPKDAAPADLPTYPFQHQSFWLAAAPSTTDAPHLGLQTADHPLLATANELPDGTTVYTGAVSTTTHPWLTDHTIGGTALLAGTAFLDLALHTHPAVHELTLHAPLPLDESLTHLQVVLGPDEDGQRAITIRSRADDVWTRHATGVVGNDTAAPPDTYDGQIPETAKPIDIDGMYERLADQGYEYGPLFQGLKSARQDGDTLYAGIELPSGADTRGFVQHPALLDAALHALALRGTSGDEVRLPFAFSGVVAHRSAVTGARVRLRPADGDGTPLTISDDEGPVVTIGAVHTRPIPRAQLAALGSARRQPYAVRWHRLTAPAPAGSSMAALGGGDLGVPAFPDLDAIADAGVPDFVLVDRRDERDEALSAAEKTLTLIQRWLADDRFADARLVVITHNAIDTDAPDLTAAPLWGLVHTAGNEHPGRFMALDADRLEPGTLATALATGGPQVAIRGGELFAPRLVQAAPADGGDWFDPDGTVLITGGTGTLGMLTARHLVTGHGARRLLLVSRTGQDAPGAAELRAELAGLGAEVAVEACDAADADALDKVTAAHTITAVIHTAGITQDAPIHALTSGDMRATWRGKAAAAGNLRRLADVHPIRTLVLFSSFAGIAGNPGQGNYAAANTYLDALARHPLPGGARTVSIAWGLWTPVTTMTDHLTGEHHRRLSRHGVVPLTPEDGLGLFDAALRTREPVVVAARLNLPALREQAGRGVLSPLFEGLVPAAARGGDAAPGESLARRLAGLDEGGRHALVLETVRSTAAAVLGHTTGAVEADQAFKELGFDSLTAVELRNRLNAATGLRLPATLIFDRPTPAALARHIHDELAPDDTGAASAAEDLDRLEERLAGLSDDERARTAITARLEAMLRRWGTGPAEEAPAEEERIRDASTAEIFDFIDTELGRNLTDHH